MAITLNSSDLIGLGVIANHCDEKKLQIAVNEAIDFDLKPTLGNLFNDISDNWSQESGDFHALIQPGTYENCAGHITTHSGVKKVLAYYAYSRYVMINSFNDTASGLVEKTDNFSIPKSLDELKQFSSKYRNMARDSWEGVEAYILKNPTSLEAYDMSCAKPCGCNGSCGTKTKNKGFGLRASTIRK